MRNRLKRKLHSISVKQNAKSKFQEGTEDAVPSHHNVSQSNLFLNVKGTEALVNELIRNRSESSRLAGLQMFITSSQERQIRENFGTQYFSGLTTTFTKIIESPITSDVERCLAAHSMNCLLLFTLDMEDVRKDSIQSSTCKLLTTCLGLKDRIFSSTETCKNATILMIKTCVKYYGASSLPLKNRLEKMIVELLSFYPGMAGNTEQTCLSTLSCLTQCGPLAMRSDLYTDTLARYCQAARYHINFLLKNCCLYEVEVKKPDDWRLIFAHDPPSIDNLRMASRQLTIYCKSLINLLKFMKTSIQCKVGVKEILELVCDMTNVSLKSKALNRQSVEMKVFRSILLEIHQQAVAILSTLFSVMKSEVLLYRFTIARVIQDEILHSTSDFSPSIVDLLLAILTQPMCSDAFTATSQLHDHVVKFILGQQRNESVLKVIELLLLHSSRDMSKSSHHSLYSWISQYGAYIHEIYDPAVRARYYVCVRASLSSYSSRCGPLTSVAVKLLSVGARDSNEQVREICYNALHSDMVHVTQPVCPPLSTHTDVPDLASIQSRISPSAPLDNAGKEAEESTNGLVPDPSVDSPPTLSNAVAESVKSPPEKTPSLRGPRSPVEEDTLISDLEDLQDDEVADDTQDNGDDVDAAAGSLIESGDGVSDEDDENDVEATINASGTRASDALNHSFPDKRGQMPAPSENANEPDVTPTDSTHPDKAIPLSAEVMDMLETFVDDESDHGE